MKNIICTILALCATMAVAQAQNLKIATVNIEQAYTNFYKVKEAEERIRGSFEIAKQESESLQEELQQLAQQIQEQQSVAENTMMSPERQQEARQKIEQLRQEGGQKQQSLQQFMQNAQRNLQERQRSQREVLLSEIRETSVEVARKKGANLLFDNSGLTGTGVPTVLYSDSSWDITEEVLTELNKGASR